MNHRAVLHVGAGADADGEHVAADGRAEPDARRVAEVHVADHGGVGGDEHALAERRADSFVLVERHRKLDSTRARRRDLARKLSFRR